MNKIIILGFLALLCDFILCQDIGQHPPFDGPVEIIPLDKESNDERWETFKRFYNKKYTSKIEEEYRRNLFEESNHQINKHNEKYNEAYICPLPDKKNRNKRCSEQLIDDKYKSSLGINVLSDLTRYEIMKSYCGFTLTDEIKYQEVIKRDPEFNLGLNHDVPKTFDWRKKLTPLNKIKKQGSCRSCWAFSAVSALEFHYKIKKNETIHFSQQNLIDCTFEDHRNTCSSGGSMIPAFEHVSRFGINKYEDYDTYSAQQGECKFNATKTILKSSGYRVVNNFKENDPNEDELTKALFINGPISVAVNANPNEFLQYKSGIFRNSNCVAKNKRDFNHAMTAVGYGTTDDGVDYYVLMNSWDKNWGEGGYMRIARNKNLCGLGYYSVYPTFD